MAASVITLEGLLDEAYRIAGADGCPVLFGLLRRALYDPAE